MNSLRRSLSLALSLSLVPLAASSHACAAYPIRRGSSGGSSQAAWIARVRWLCGGCTTCRAFLHRSIRQQTSLAYATSPHRVLSRRPHRDETSSLVVADVEFRFVPKVLLLYFYEKLRAHPKSSHFAHHPLVLLPSFLPSMLSSSLHLRRRKRGRFAWNITTPRHHCIERSALAAAKERTRWCGDRRLAGALSGPKLRSRQHVPLCDAHPKGWRSPLAFLPEPTPGAASAGYDGGG